MSPVAQAAIDYVRAGLSVVPVRRDGSKGPVGKWMHLQTERPNENDVVRMFGGRVGIGILGGAVSGGLEVFDFDRPGVFEAWVKLVEATCPGLVVRLPVVETPVGGHHVYARSDKSDRNQKLAMAKEPWGKKDGLVLIETRGEGGYVVAPPSPPDVHKEGKPYVHVAGPALTEIPTISTEERRILIQCARAFHEREERTHEPPKHIDPVAGRPGDDFNERADWGEILGPHGWAHVYTQGEKAAWRRPGKDDGVSATTGAVGDKLYVFSSNAPPFESERAYSKFSAYAVLNYHGDWSAAAAQLSKQGYGTRGERSTEQHVKPEPEPRAGAATKAERLTMADSFNAWLNYSAPPHIPTGFYALDKAIRGGLPVGQVTCIGGYTGVGKSEVARQIRTRAARAGHPVVHVDVELGHRRIMERELCQRTGLPISVLGKRKGMTDAQWADLLGARDELSKLPITYLGGLHGSGPDELRGAILEEVVRLRESTGQASALVILDSAHRLSAGFPGADVRLQTRNFMYWVEALAKELDVAVLITGEHKRGADGKRPTADDVLTAGAETRALEFQSDCVIGLVPVEEASDGVAGDPDERRERRVSAIVAKTRDGAVGYLRKDLVFVSPCWEMIEGVRDDAIKDKIRDALVDRPLSQNEIEKAIKGKAAAIRSRLRQMSDEGEIEYLQSARKWRLNTDRDH